MDPSMTGMTGTGEATLVDFVLAPALLLLAAVLLNVRALFTALVLFVVFGLLMAVTWARLGAVDVALAEAAIGAGLTGALLFNAHAELRASGGERPGERPGERAGQPSASRRVIAAVLVLPLLAGLGVVVWQIPAELPGLGPALASERESVGLAHPVSAVLLSVRAYDTLLELGVLLIAALGLASVHARSRIEPEPASSLLSAVERLLLPTTVLLAGYLLWRASHGPGGAFQAGTVLAAALILTDLHARSTWLERRAWVRLGLAVGVGSFVGAGLVGPLIGHPPLTWRVTSAARIAATLELLATPSIALALFVLVRGRAWLEPDGDAP